MIKIINRSMSVPIPDRTVGYKGDNLVEIRTFELNRFYGDIDLSEFDFKLDTEINGTKNIIDFDKAVSQDKITLTWTIAESHILHPGHMSIQLRAFSQGEEKWHSAQDYVLVQPSINATEALPDPLPSEFEQMEQRVTVMKTQAEAAAQTAEEQANIVKVVVEDAETEVLPAVLQAIEDAGDAKDLLNGSIEAAGTAKSQLDGSISAAGPAKTGLDGSISSAGVAKTQLDGSISSANGIKSQLDGSITAAGQAKELLDESIATGDLDSFKADYMQFKNDSTLESAKIEKELNDYKATLAGMNPNQEPKQKVNGYGIIPLPKNAANGQVSAILKGNTWTNRAGIGDTSPQTIENLDSAKTYLLIKTDGGTVNVDAVDTAVPAKITGKTSTVLTWASGKIALYELSTAEAALTEAQLGARYHYVSGVKSTVSAMRIRIVSEDEAEGSTAYVLAKDEDGNIEELRSLPNGTKDEVNVTSGVMSQRVSDNYILTEADIEQIGTVASNVDYVITRVLQNKSTISSDVTIVNTTYIPGRTEVPNSITAFNDIKYIGSYANRNDGKLIFVVAKGTTLAQAKTALAGTTLNYQLAEPIEIPIQVSGTLLSNPSGTIYVENVVADAGIYTDKMTVLHQDLPIDYIERVSKVDFATGIETELDITAAVIAEDKLSFTHPDLTSGDIVFFVYEHGAEGTIPETEISYYDSRYVIKGEDDKFYQWEIEAKLVEGVITPSIKLGEV